ncbi:MAG: hypothetical protein HYV09_30865 [Deltaproteobacteria bacterium]|nr:hypothetical protein [Deltaproteobacteria bacterium]
MSGTYTGAEVANLLRWQRDEVDATLERANQAVRHHERMKAELSAQLQQAQADLGAALLPQLDPAWLSRAIQLTGYTPFQHQDPIGQREKERAQIHGELAQIDADPAMREAELLRHPRTGTLVVKRAELMGHRAPWAEVLDRAAHPRLPHLIDVGYGTERYDVPFWRLSYYQDWQAGDEILEKFPGKQAFGEVRDEILRARETVTTFDQAIGDVDRQLAYGAQLEQRRAQLAHELSRHDARYLHGARERLVQHLLTVDAKAIKPWVSADPNVELLYLRASGLAAKMRYLDAMIQEHAQKASAQLYEQRQGLERQIAKYSRPKKLYATYPRDLIDQRTRSRKERWDKHFRRLESSYTTVYVYDDWSRARSYHDLSWWHVMTDGRASGSYIPEVAAFEREHPDWRPARDDFDDFDDSAAAAAAAVEVEAVGSTGHGVDLS